MLENWCAAGFAPDSFWEQTSATYNSAMLGALQARKADHETAVAGAWWGEYFHREKRMGPLGKYLKKMRGEPENKAAEIAAAFKSMQSRGLNIKVRRVARDG